MVSLHIRMACRKVVRTQAAVLALRELPARRVGSIRENDH